MQFLEVMDGKIADENQQKTIYSPLGPVFGRRQV